MTKQMAAIAVAAIECGDGAEMANQLQGQSNLTGPPRLPQTAEELNAALDKKLVALQGPGTRRRNWPIDSTARASVVLYFWMLRAALHAERAHKYRHRSHGEALCGRDCLERDLCVALALVLEEADISRAAPKWLLIADAVRTIARFHPRNEDALKHRTVRDLALLGAAWRRPKAERTPHDSEVIRSFGASIPLLNRRSR